MRSGDKDRVKVVPSPGFPWEAVTKLSPISMHGVDPWPFYFFISFGFKLPDDSNVHTVKVEKHLLRSYLNCPVKDNVMMQGGMLRGGDSQDLS